MQNVFWRQLGLTAEDFRSLPGKFVLGVLAPQILFFGGWQRGELNAGLMLAFAWTAGLQLSDIVRRRGFNPMLSYGLGFTLMQGGAALLAHSPAVYVGGGIVENMLDGLVLLGSVVACRPLLPVLVGSVLAGRAVLTLPMQAVLKRLTVFWAVLLIVRSVALYAALTHLTIGQFLIVNTLGGWPLSAVCILASFEHIRRHFRRWTMEAESCV
jgi:intracellular septation protein A